MTEASREPWVARGLGLEANVLRGRVTISSRFVAMNFIQRVRQHVQCSCRDCASLRTVTRQFPVDKQHARDPGVSERPPRWGWKWHGVCSPFEPCAPTPRDSTGLHPASLHNVLRLR